MHEWLKPPLVHVEWWPSSQSNPTTMYYCTSKLTNNSKDQGVVFRSTSVKDGQHQSRMIGCHSLEVSQRNCV